MKNLKLIWMLLVVSISISFTTNTDFIKKEVLFTADLLIDGEPSREKIEIFVRSRRQQVVSLTVRGYIDRWWVPSFFDIDKTLKVSELDRTKNNKLVLKSKAINRVLSIQLDKEFNKDGGLVYVEVKTSDGVTQHNQVYVSYENETFVAYLDKITPSHKIMGLNIRIVTKEDDEGEVELYTIKTEFDTFTFPER